MIKKFENGKRMIGLIVIILLLFFVQSISGQNISSDMNESVNKSINISLEVENVSNNILVNESIIVSSNGTDLNISINKSVEIIEEVEEVVEVEIKEVEVTEGKNNKVSFDTFINNSNNKTKVKIKPNKLIKEILFESNEVSKNLEVEIKDVESQYIEIPEQILNTFSIGFTGDFEDATIVSVAKGNVLYECQEFDLENSVCNNEWTKIKDIIPGEEYEVKTSSTNTAYAETGVASINTVKPIYFPDEVVEIIVTVLDTKGMLVNNVDLEIIITNPDGEEEIITSDSERIERIGDGIFKTEYVDSSIIGKYDMKINAQGVDVDFSMESFFYVLESYEFDILRDTPSTTDPFTGPFSSSIEIINYVSNEIFSFTEILPASFDVVDANGALVTEIDDKKYLQWSNLESQDIISYVAMPPKITPNLFALGRAFVSYSSGKFFEARPWYLAIDPQNFYDPNSSISSNWAEGTGITYVEIDDGIRYNDVPDTGNYLASKANDNVVSEFGFPTISGGKLINMTLWVYTGTGSNAQYTFYLMQGATQRCSRAMSTSSATQWYSCSWTSPTGDLSDLRVRLGGVTKSGGGQNQNAFAYAAYIEVNTAAVPQISLEKPDNNSVETSTPIDFNFTATDDDYSTIDNCTLWGNFSGSWQSNYTINNVANASQQNVTLSPTDGTYFWNVECFEGTGYSNTSSNNRTVTVNAISPAITNLELNTTLINQSETVRFNSSITDFFGIDSNSAKVEIRYPNETIRNYSLSNSGSEYYYTFTDTNLSGIYNITLVWANDTLGQEGYNSSPWLSFQVTPSNPGQFNVSAPANNTISNNRKPTLQWTQTTDSNFDNYTILIDANELFSSPDFIYSTQQITNTSFDLTSDLSQDTTYYWKVRAYDEFGSSTDTTNYFYYITDNTPPTISLNKPNNGDFYLSSLVYFNYTPADTYLKNCTLFGNFSGGWNYNETNTTPLNSVTNRFGVVLGDGTYLWNVQCFDEADNSNFSSANYTVKVDTNPPLINLVSPGNNTLENTTNNIDFVYNVSDYMTTIASCKLIVDGSVVDTEITVDENQNINFTAFVNNGQHNWSINCTDNNGFENYTHRYNLSVDVTIEVDPPIIVLNDPTPFEYVDTNNIVFNYTTSDATGIENCSLYIDGTFNVTNSSTVINNVPNYFNINGLSEVEHSWYVSCFDNNTYIEGTSDPDNFTVDLTNPVVNLNLPSDNYISNFSSITFNVTPIDTNIANCSLYGNFTSSFIFDQLNSTPVSNQDVLFTKTLDDGEYLWNSLCFDYAGRNTFNSTNYTIIVDSSVPILENFSQSPSSPETFTESAIYYFNASAYDTFLNSVWIENNFSGTLTNYTVTDATGSIYKYNYSELSVGNYSFRWYANDSVNRINVSQQFYYYVGKASPTLNLYLNGSQSNLNIVEETDVNITAEIVSPSNGNIELYENGVLINNGTGTLENISTYSVPGNYNITAKYISTENFSYSQKSYSLEVNDTYKPVVNQIYPYGINLGNPEVTFQYNVSDESTVVNCSIYFNGTYNDTDTTITKDTLQTFSKEFADGSYTWSLTCTDLYNNTNTTGELTFNVSESQNMLVDVQLDNSIYEKGETMNISVVVNDSFNQPIFNATTQIDIISPQGRIGWWNSSWTNRKPIYINETSGSDRTNEFTEVNVTGISDISDCAVDLRVIQNESSDFSEVPFVVYGGDNSTWCNLGFRINITGSETNQNNYYAYYNNSAAPTPSYSVSTDAYYLFNAQTAGNDEGTPTNINNVIGRNDGNFATITASGGGATQVSGSGRAPINLSLTNEIRGVDARYRYAVTSCTSNWYLRYSVDDGGSYSNSYIGTTSQTLTTSNWDDITADYASLTWTELNRTRLQGRISKPGGGSGCTLNLYWVELNVSVKASKINMDTSVGAEETLVVSNTTYTNALGFENWIYNSLNLEYGNYSAVALAQKQNFLNTSAYEDFEIVPDATKPTITLNSPVNEFNTSNSSVSFNWTMTDFSGNSTCNLTINGVTNKTTLSNTSIPTTTTINGFNEAKYNWSVVCIDYNGNYNNSDSRNFTVDQTGPQISLTEPVEGYNTSNSSIRFNWTGTDALSQIVYCQLYIDGSNYSSNITSQNNTNANFTASSITSGSHNWNVACFDSSGNQNTSSLRTFVIISGPVNATANISGTDIEVSWPAVSVADYYNIYFTSNYTAGFSGLPDVSNITDTNYTDTTAGSSVSRFYRVSSVRGGAESMSNRSVGKYDIELHSGYNMISSPFTLSSYTLKDAGDNGFEFNPNNECIVSLWSYDADDGFERTDWLGNGFVPGGGSESFTSLDKTEGYWIEANNTCNITVFGEVPFANQNIAMKADYNLLPWYSPEVTDLPTDYETPLFNTTPADTVNSINRFNPVTQLYEVTVHYTITGTPWGWVPSGGSGFTQLEPMRAYFIDTDNVATWIHRP